MATQKPPVITSGRVMIDLLDRHTQVAQAPSSRGLAIQRHIARITLDRDAPFGDDHLMMAVAGPELG